MQEDKHLKEILTRGGTIAASPALDEAIMKRVQKIAAARKKARHPLLNIRLMAGLVLSYTLVSLLVLLISYMLDQGFTFTTRAIPQLFALDAGRAGTLVFSLLAFWVLMFFNLWLKKYFKKFQQK
ncbi:hypothetical protein D770_12595 [Flammeovirgaceae bacterium 311]|nr:hypothetical protein D770_12595 [Flammeovirgaceae bacterium 311]